MDTLGPANFIVIAELSSLRGKVNAMVLYNYREYGPQSFSIIERCPLRDGFHCLYIKLKIIITTIFYFIRMYVRGMGVFTSPLLSNDTRC